MNSFLGKLRAGIVVILVLLGGASVPAAASTQTVDYLDSTVRATNVQRVKHDLGKVGRDDCLQKMAQAQARRMAQQSRLFHQDLGAVQKRCGMGWAGENVAYGYDSGSAVVRAWMNSPGHRANILSSHYRKMGIGAVEKNGTWWVAQVFGTRA